MKIVVNTKGHIGEVSQDLISKMEERKLAIKNMLKKLLVEEVIELGYDKDMVMKIAEEKI